MLERLRLRLTNRWHCKRKDDLLPPQPGPLSPTVLTPFTGAPIWSNPRAALHHDREFKRADNANIGFHVWQYAVDRPWHHVIDHATPEQLACLGIPLPGDPFWTPSRCSSANRAGRIGT